MRLAHRSRTIGVVKATTSSLLSIQYVLYGDINNTFDLNSSTGVLTLSNTLDYETISIYKLTIEARSSSSSSTVAPSFSEITIQVLNTNDNPPDINVMFYPSIFFERNLIKYDVNMNSTPLATINVKDLDESTTNLTLILNDTKHFQLQFVRQSKNGLLTESIYILSTRNNAQLIEQDFYYLSLNSCDNDLPSLWTNRTYKFHLKPNENLCQFNQTSYIIDIKENLPNRTLILSRLTNQFCPSLFYSIDDTQNFFIQSQTGDIYTSKLFNREEQSIYQFNLQAIDRYNKTMKVKLTIRILDEYGHIPFLLQKKLKINRRNFSSIDLFNSTYCHYQTKSFSNSEENVHNKYDAISTLSKLKVHDDHQLSPSPISTTIYLVQKSTASSPARDDEGYSGSSDVSENPLSMETTILTANQLVEQYRIHEFRTHQTISPSSDNVLKRLSTSCVSPDVSLV
ncbi:hypothetical protein I4U23_030184 [Adineta vaga]|nr:hypothetical protein I4U23_030184 [Adineta vaga]